MYVYFTSLVKGVLELEDIIIIIGIIVQVFLSDNYSFFGIFISIAAARYVMLYALSLHCRTGGDMPCQKSPIMDVMSVSTNHSSCHFRDHHRSQSPFEYLPIKKVTPNAYASLFSGNVLFFFRRKRSGSKSNLSGNFSHAMKWHAADWFRSVTICRGQVRPINVSQSS